MEIKIKFIRNSLKTKGATETQHPRQTRGFGGDLKKNKSKEVEGDLETKERYFWRDKIRPLQQRVSNDQSKSEERKKKGERKVVSKKTFSVKRKIGQTRTEEWRSVS